MMTCWSTAAERHQFQVVRGPFCDIGDWLEPGVHVNSVGLVGGELDDDTIVKSLIVKGIDLNEIIRVSENLDAHGTLVEVEEHKKNERIVISLE